MDAVGAGAGGAQGRDAGAVPVGVLDQVPLAEVGPVDLPGRGVDRGALGAPGLVGRLGCLRVRADVVDQVAAAGAVEVRVRDRRAEAVGEVRPVDAVAPRVDHHPARLVEGRGARVDDATDTIVARSVGIELRPPDRRRAGHHVVVGPVQGPVGPVRRVDREPVRAGDRRGAGDVEVAAAGAVEVRVGDRRAHVVGPVGPVDAPVGGVERQTHRPVDGRAGRVDGSAAAVSIEVRPADRVGLEVRPVDPVGGVGGGGGEQGRKGDKQAEAEAEQAAAGPPRWGGAIGNGRVEIGAHWLRFTFLGFSRPQSRGGHDRED